MTVLAFAWILWRSRRVALAAVVLGSLGLVWASLHIVPFSHPDAVVPPYILWTLTAILLPFWLSVQRFRGNLPFLLARPVSRSRIWFESKLVEVFLAGGVIGITLVGYWFLARFIYRFSTSPEILHNTSLIYAILISAVFFFISSFLESLGATFERWALLAGLVLVTGYLTLVGLSSSPLDLGADIGLIFGTGLLLMLMFGLLSFLIFSHEETLLSQKKVIRWLSGLALLACILAAVSLPFRLQALSPKGSEIKEIAEISISRRNYIHFLGKEDHRVGRIWTVKDDASHLRCITHRMVFPERAERLLASWPIVRFHDWFNSDHLRIRKSEQWEKISTARWPGPCGFPFISPDRDRVALLNGFDVTIALLDRPAYVSFPIGDSGSGKLSAVGWTPNGDDFYLLKSSTKGDSEVWAVDRLAQKTHRVLSELPSIEIAEADLSAGIGDWISCLSKRDGFWTFWAYNTVTQKRLTVADCLSRSPVRAWSAESRLAYWVPERGLVVIQISDHQVVPVMELPAPEVRELKWSPKGRYLGVLSEGLDVVDVSTGTIERVVHGYRPEVWDWLDEKNLVYVRDATILAVKTDGNRQWQVFP